LDSLTQLTLGAAVGVAVMGRRTAAWKSALWGGVAGTLPDLDVLVSHGDAILDMVLHRAESHALFWQTLFSLPFAAAVARLHGEWGQRRRWWLALWLALVTHPLLDTLTIYGTQLALPFTNHPFGVGSVFIIDPAVTLPWLVGVAWAVAAGGGARGLKANLVGLGLGVAYLAWGVAAQGIVEQKARQSLAAQGLAPGARLFATPAPFNTLLWRVVVVEPGAVHEGFWSFFDAPGPIRFFGYDRGAALEEATAQHDGARRIRAFSGGFYRLLEANNRIRITDLRMGQYPGFVFDFEIAERSADGRIVPLPASVNVGQRGDVGEAMRWLWRRMWGEPVAPPGWPAVPVPRPG
jgi:inner membrane protein